MDHPTMALEEAMYEFENSESNTLLKQSARVGIKSYD